MSDLLTDVTLRYETFQFPVETTLEGIECRPNWDAAGRTIVSVTHSLSVKTVLWSDVGSVDDDMAAIKAILLQPAGELIINGAGFGNLHVNPSGGGGTRDVVWGPKPSLLSWKPKGHNRAVEIAWRVEFCLPVCQTQATYTMGVMEFNYKVTWKNDKSGYVTRTYSGHVQVPATRNSPASRTLVDQADRLREQVTPPVPSGFRRTSAEYPLDEAKTRMEFSITDELAPANLPPPSCVEVHADHSIESLSGQGLLRWNCVLNATYEVSRAAGRAAAFQMFVDLAHDRANRVQTTFLGLKAATPFILQFGCREPEIYGRDVASFTLRYFFSTTIGQVVKASGLWTKPAGSDYDPWAKSMVKDLVWDPRGLARSSFKKEDDTIIDLCLAKEPRSLRGELRPQQRELKTGLIDIFPKPPPDRSWIQYRTGILERVHNEVRELKTLPLKPFKLNTPGDPDADSQDGFSTNETDGPASIIQTAAASSSVVFFTGSAVRAGYAITPPRLTSIGGVECVPQNQGQDTFQTWVISNFGFPVVAARWCFRYILATPHKVGLKAPDNLLYGSVDGSSSLHT